MLHDRWWLAATKACTKGRGVGIWRRMVTLVRWLMGLKGKLTVDLNEGVDVANAITAKQLAGWLHTGEFHVRKQNWLPQWRSQHPRQSSGGIAGHRRATYSGRKDGKGNAKTLMIWARAIGNVSEKCTPPGGDNIPFNQSDLTS